MGMGWRWTVSSRAALAMVLVIGVGACSTTDVTARVDAARVTASSTTTTTTTTTITVPAARPSVPSTVAVLPRTGPDPTLATACADALAYLASHQAPGFVDSCRDGAAFGHLGVTCADAAAMCPGVKFIRIACPAPFVYMNEAHNSWTLIGQRSGIDPYGQGTPAQRAACAPHR